VCVFVCVRERESMAAIPFGVASLRGANFLGPAQGDEATSDPHVREWEDTGIGLNRTESDGEQVVIPKGVPYFPVVCCPTKTTPRRLTRVERALDQSQGGLERTAPHRRAVAEVALGVLRFVDHSRTSKHKLIA
jgi:hypothetical protein